MAWCFNTKASVPKVLSMHPWVSSYLWVKLDRDRFDAGNRTFGPMQFPFSLSLVFWKEINMTESSWIFVQKYKVPGQQSIFPGYVAG